MSTYKSGTRIQVRIFPLDGSEAWEDARIGRLHRSWKDKDTRGYHPVTFPDGGKLMVHENCFRVVDNRGMI